MKIIDKDTSSKKDWSLVQVGDLFRIGGDNDIYMRIEDNASGYNAVSLNSGMMVSIYLHKVYVVNAHLVEE